MWPNDTQQHGYQMFDRQIVTDHTRQPDGYQSFDGQTHCLTDKQTNMWPNDTATWQPNV